MAGERADAIPELADLIAWVEEQRAYCRPPHLADAPAEEVDARRGACAAYGAVVYGLLLDKLRPLVMPGERQTGRERPDAVPEAVVDKVLMAAGLPVNDVARINMARGLAAAAPLLPGGEEAERLREALRRIRDHFDAHDEGCQDATSTWDCADSMMDIARSALARPEEPPPDAERAPQEDR